MSPGRAKVLVICFLLIITFPLVDQLVGISSSVKSQENRALAPWPDLNINQLDDYPESFETWFSDNFKARGHLLKTYQSLRTDMLQMQAFPDRVLEGQAGWYYWVPDVLNDYRGIGSFTSDELEKLNSELKRRGQWCENRDILYAVVVVPNKMSVYPEHLPENVTRLNSQTRLDQLNEIAAKQSSYQLIDLREALISQKKKGRLYHKTDTHWNELGSYYGYLGIISALQHSFPEMKAVPLDDYHIDSTLTSGQELAKSLGIEDLISEQEINTHTRREYWQKGVKKGYQPPEDFAYSDQYEEVFLTNNNSLPSLFVTRDSYANALVDFLPRNFNRTVMIWDKWEYALNEELIEKEKPNVVITLLIERHLPNILYGERN